MIESTKSSNRFIKVALFASLILNLALAGLLFLHSSVTPTGKIGVLAQDVEATAYGTNTVMFKIPKGATVRDESPRGINAMGMLDRHRIAIVLTFENPKTVEFSTPNPSTNKFGEFYSIKPVELPNHLNPVARP